MALKLGVLTLALGASLALWSGFVMGRGALAFYTLGWLVFFAGLVWMVRERDERER